MKQEISSGGIIVFGNTILLLRKYNGDWVLPKGKVEDDESVKQAAIREVYEEAGVKAKVEEYVGKINLYLEALDRDVKRSNENPSIGIILCPDVDKVVVEYAMSRSMSPTMVAEYKRILIPQEKMQQQLREFCQFFSKEDKS